MQKTIKKTESILSIFKDYILPIIVFICSIVVAWAILNTTVVTNAKAIKGLEVRCDENESVINLVLQRLSSIDTKLEYIIKELDSIDK